MLNIIISLLGAWFVMVICSADFNRFMARICEFLADLFYARSLGLRIGREEATRRFNHARENRKYV